MGNTIIFENGVKHDFTEEEMYVLRSLINNINEICFIASEEYVEALTNLKLLFLDHLD